MLAAFNRVLLRGQTECIPTHRVQHTEAAHAFVPRDDVSGRVTFGMSHVQARPAWVREHVEDVKFWLRRIEILLTGIKRMKELPLLPNALPFGFDVVEWMRFATLVNHTDLETNNTNEH